MSAQVTAMGIRDGDPAVLQALVNRRGAAVLAYCEHACAPSVAIDAVADAFTRFRAAVLATDNPAQLDPEAALLHATRHAATARSPRPASEGATGLSRVFGGRGTPNRLREVPDLLLAREEGTLGAEDAAALDGLLAGSPVARSIEARFAAAEEAYRTAPRHPLAPAITDQVVATMSALAAPPTNGHHAAPIPVEQGPAPRFFRDDLDPEEWPPPTAPQPTAAAEPEAAAELEAAADPAPDPFAIPIPDGLELPPEPPAPPAFFTPSPLAAFPIPPAPSDAEAGEPAPAAESSAPGEGGDAGRDDDAPLGASDVAEGDDSAPLGASDRTEEDDAAPPLGASDVTEEDDTAPLGASDVAEGDDPAPLPAAAEVDAVVDDDATPMPSDAVEDDAAPPAAGGETVEWDAEDDGTVEWTAADAPVSVDDAVPDSAEIAAARGEEHDPSPATVEWSVPEDELGASPELEHEIAAARLGDQGIEEDPGHLQSASGALAEEDVPDGPVAHTVPRPRPEAAAPVHAHRLGRTALAPAAAVVAIAAIGALAASGVFGGNDPSPPVDTGIVPERALQAVPEGEASAIVDDLRSAAADARRRRLADLRQQLAAEQQAAPVLPPASEEGTTTAPDETAGTTTGTQTTGDETTATNPGTTTETP